MERLAVCIYYISEEPQATIELKKYLGLRVTQDAYFSLMTHTKQLLLVTFCDTTARI